MFWEALQTVGRLVGLLWNGLEQRVGASKMPRAPCAPLARVQVAVEDERSM